MKKYIALVLAAVLVLGIFTGCGNKGNKETESQTDEKVTESVNSAENNTEDSTQNSTENQNVADTEQLLRIIQSIPSPKAEPFKLWLAQVVSTVCDQ